MADYDAIIIGAGHNGLVCAAYLAKSGRRVLVLEAAEDSGGLAASREFHPGFKASVAHSAAHFPTEIIAELDLVKHGLSDAADTDRLIGLDTNGDHVCLESGGIQGASDGDSAAYDQFRTAMQRFAKALRPFWLKTMPRIGSRNLADLLTLGHLGFNIRRLGKQDMEELLRIATLPMRDLMDENFDSELLKATLSWDGLIGAKLAPRSPNSAVLTMLYRMSGESVAVGGLIPALESAATTHGAEIRTNATVGRILIAGNEDGLRSTGVRLQTGEEIHAQRVISAADPKRTFLDLVGIEYLDIGFTNRIRRLRCDGYVAKLHLALKELPTFSGLEAPNGRLIMAPEMDTLEFSFDNAKYGELPDTPVIEAKLPTLLDSSLAPPGQHVLSANVMYVPYKLKGGWTDASRQDMCDRAIAEIERYAPGLREQIIHQELLTPVDLEQRFRVTGGHWHHTEMAMDQMLMMRPTYDAAQYSTPIPGLHLCSAGCHPGGGLSGAAGHNAAKEILR